MPVLTMPQQRRAVHFTVLFLKQEIEDIQTSLKQTTGNERKLLERRLNELQSDLETFSEINEQLSV